MSLRLNNFIGPFQKTQSSSLTSFSSFNFSKPLKDIKYTKALNFHYSFSKNLTNKQKSYEKISPSKNTIVNIQSSRKNQIYKIHAKKDSGLQHMSLLIILRQKLKTLIKSVFNDLQIFKKIQGTLKRQKSLISKLYGWDQKFAKIFFEGEQIKSCVNQQIVENIFFNGKQGRYDSQPRSLYHKMKHFQSSLKQFNIKKQSLKIFIKGKQIQQSTGRLGSKLKMLQNPENEFPQILLTIRNYIPSKEKKSLRKILSMKGHDDQQLKLDSFDIQQSQGCDILQEIVQDSYKSCNIIV